MSNLLKLGRELQGVESRVWTFEFLSKYLLGGRLNREKTYIMETTNFLKGSFAYKNYLFEYSPPFSVFSERIG